MPDKHEAVLNRRGERTCAGLSRLLHTALLIAGTLFITPLAADSVEKILFLVIDDDEIIASNTKLGRFDRLEMHAKEKLLDYRTANAVAVVVTNQRVAAYGVLTGKWNSRRIQAGEKVESLEAGGYSATLVTSDRLLNFYGRTGTWSETKR